MDKQLKLLIGGSLAEGGAGTFDVVNPATGKAFAQCPKASEAQLDEAVAAAKAAFPAWAATDAGERGAMLAKLADALEARVAEFASLLTMEQGKPTRQAMGEIIGSTYVLRAFVDKRVEPVVLRDKGGKTVTEHRTPLGVVAAITPWNYPVMMLVQKLAPALVTGNTMVLKPAPTTPLTSLLFAELASEILPAGVFNVICDENDLGGKLTAHPGVAKIAFTGSTATGKKVMASAAAMVKRVTLELGGNDAAIVLDDIDAKAVAKKIYEGAMTNAGQICVAIKRAYVPANMYDAFCEEIARLANEAIVDDGSKQGTTVGPVQNRQQFEKVKELVEDAKLHGKVIAGGEALDRDGYFMPPTIVRDLPDDARLVREEQFGPVLPVLKYDDIDDVIARANASEYGLGGSVWGKDLTRATEVAQKIDTGTVWVNQYLAIDPRIPFRGSKQSGLGTELGDEGMLEYTQAHIVNAVPFEDA